MVNGIFFRVNGRFLDQYGIWVSSGTPRTACGTCIFTYLSSYKTEKSPDQKWSEPFSVLIYLFSLRRYLYFAGATDLRLATRITPKSQQTSLSVIAEDSAEPVPKSDS